MLQDGNSPDMEHIHNTKDEPIISRKRKRREGEGEKKKKKKTTTHAVALIAKPLAGKKLRKRTLKLVRKAAEQKCLKSGVKEVVKSIRRGQKGLCVIAGKISPIDVITHVPVLCEEAGIPYVYVSSKDVEIHAEVSNSSVLIHSNNDARTT
ncbi:H/ACA ribonucleoprotein complex subunit 2-like protein [Argentina anserina]|uniref:H/ACA ribonucleoprotein complex subunit 2-like protein n=1 Tax=Argentina anserina TaxID=57926 RepID=UPI00217650D4|nr:H/ACA ribonucleoprotein complex subunit 2-like protein [Potentilla anserina]